MQTPITEVPVSTTRPGLNPGQELICVTKRETKQSGSIPEDQRFRGIVIPSDWITLPSDACRSAFTAILQRAIFDVAADRLSAYLSEDWNRKTVPAASFTIPNLLTYWAEEKQRSSIDGKQISEWIKAQAWIPADVLSGWQAKVPTIAAPSYRNLFKKTQAASISSRILQSGIKLENDPIAAYIVQRCSNILATEEQEQAL